MHKKTLLISIVLVFICCFLFFKHYFSVFYFQNDVNKISVNIEAKNLGELNICFNQQCDKMNFQKGIYSYKLNQENPLFYNGEVENIEIISKKDITKKIESISVFSGFHLNYFKNSDLKTQEIEFSNDKAYSISLDYKINSKSFIQKISVYFLSLFHNWYFWLLGYILLAIYFIKYHQRFELKIKHPIFLILFLGIFLRLSHIDFIPLWNDELYTFCFISNMGEGFNLKRAIVDPGNPPLFFILSNFWLLFFNKNIFLIRLLPCLIGIIQIYLTYFLINKLLNKKTALVASFLCAINIFIILESNEIRSYILSMTLIPLGAFLFYKLKENPNYRNFLYYCLISILLINLHYYSLLFILSNFILGFFILKNSRIKFLICNFISFLSFIPYFQTTVINQSFQPTFNTWLEKPSIDLILNHITFFFGNIIFFLITIIFCIFILKKVEKNEKRIFLYNTYSIVCVFILAFLISLYKPILFERYFSIFLPFLIINSSIILTLNYKEKFNFLIIFIIFLFQINMPKYENFNLFSNIDSMMKYSSKDYLNYQKEYDIYFVIPDYVDYSKYYKEIPSNKLIVSNYGIREDVDLLKEYLKNKKSKKILLYLPEICINSKIKFSKELNIKRINTTTIPIYKIYIN